MSSAITPAWSEALAAYEAMHGAGPSALRLAAEGHPNRDGIVRMELENASGCPCGGSEPCTPDCDPPERQRLRAALESLTPCECCGSLGASLAPDPYAHEICGDDDNVLWCDNCREQSGRDI